MIPNFLGALLAEPVTVDLGELNPATGRPLLTIL
jgi:hypothetical protein